MCSMTIPREQESGDLLFTILMTQVAHDLNHLLTQPRVQGTVGILGFEAEALVQR
jgi:hypothetical protein